MAGALKRGGREDGRRERSSRGEGGYGSGARDEMGAAGAAARWGRSRRGQETKELEGWMGLALRIGGPGEAMAL